MKFTRRNHKLELVTKKSTYHLKNAEGKVVFVLNIKLSDDGGERLWSFEYRRCTRGLQSRLVARREYFLKKSDCVDAAEGYYAANLEN